MQIIGELKKYAPKKPDAKVKEYYKGHIGKCIPVTAFAGTGKNEGKIFLCLDHERAAYFDKKSQDERTGKKE